MPSVNRSERDDPISPVTVEDVEREARSLWNKVINDVGKSSAIRQFGMGCAAGWLTGFLFVRIGKSAAAAIGGGVVLIQIANNQGLIKINWDRIYKRADEITRVVEQTTGMESDKIISKVDKFVDRKLDKIEGALKKKEKNIKKWYYRNILDEEPFFFQEIHIFMASYVAGIAVGMITGKIF